MPPVSRKHFFLYLCKKRWSLTTFFWCLLLTTAGAVPAQYRFDSWTTDNGLPQVSINHILQTRDGFLWFSTFGGLVRYDGLRFQVFASGNTKGIKTSRFGQMLEDRDGNLWISTEGQGVTRYKDGKFATYTTDNGLPANVIQRLDAGSNGALILTSNNSLVQWNGESFTPYVPAENEPVQNIVYRSPGGAIWYLEDSHLRKFENGQVTVDFVPEFKVLRAFEDSGGRVWMAATDRNELFMLKDGELRTYAEKDGFSKYRYGSIREDPQGKIWFGTGAGLFCFSDGKFTRFTMADGLISDFINNSYQDREGTIWVGSGSGLNRMTKRTISAYSMKDGLASDNIYPIYQDRKERIWIGSWPGLSVYENGVFRNVRERFQLGADNVSALFEDREGGIWVGTWSGKIKREINGQVTSYLSSNELGSLRIIYQDRAGTMWFGTTKGLVKFENGTYTAFSTKDGLAGKEVIVIHEDRAGQLWIGSEGGLAKYKDGTFTRFTEKDGILGNMIRSIYEDKAGVLWIGTYDSGLYRLKDEQFTHYTTEDGLFDNGAFQIIEDNHENFWISCNLGIYRVKKSELNELAAGQLQKISAIPYNKLDGMLNSECNGGMQPAGIMTRSGHIWFPTQKGIAVVNPETVPFNAQPPPVVIESLLIDTKPVEFNSTVKVQPEQTNLEIHYSGLSFINPELVKFKYKLDGLDTDWIDAGTRRTAYYPHLPPGKYRFTVTAANRDGVWNDTGTTIEIEVFPPFWRTWWFLTLAFVAVALSGFAFYRWRVGMLKQAKETQEKFSRQLMESQENERRRIAVELHDSLGQSLVLIKNWALLAMKATDVKDISKARLKEISEMASETINEVREISYNLGPYQLDRLGLSSTIEEMIQKVAKSSPICFETKIDKVDGRFTKQEEINIFRIVQEAVNNIVKHSEATNAHLSVKMDATQVYLTISDNGKGFAQESSNGHGKRGFGLLGMAERVNLLKGEYIIKSERGKGTTVVINLRCNNPTPDEH